MGLTQPGPQTFYVQSLSSCPLGPFPVSTFLGFARDDSRLLPTEHCPASARSAALSRPLQYVARSLLAGRGGTSVEPAVDEGRGACSLNSEKEGAEQSPGCSVHSLQRGVFLSCPRAAKLSVYQGQSHRLSVVGCEREALIQCCWEQHRQLGRVHFRCQEAGEKGLSEPFIGKLLQ